LTHVREQEASKRAPENWPTSPFTHSRYSGATLGEITSVTCGRLSLLLHRWIAALAIRRNSVDAKTEYSGAIPSPAPFSDSPDLDGVGRRPPLCHRGTFRGVFCRPRRTDGRLGDQRRFWRIFTLDRGKRARTRQSIGPTLGFNARMVRWLPSGRKQYGPSGATLDLGGANVGGTAGQTLKAWPSSDWSHDVPDLRYHTPGPDILCFWSDGNKAIGGSRHLHSALPGSNVTIPFVATDAGSVHLSSRRPPRHIGHWRITPNRRKP